MDKLQSQTIDVVRFPMAALIVLLHTGALGLGSSQPIYRSLSILTNAGICRLAVPCFFFISGYLFFTKLQVWNWSIWGGKLNGRLRSLFVPYLLWNLIAAVLIFGFRLWESSKAGIVSLSFIQHIKEWDSLWDPSLPFDGPLWFIRDLMILCLLAPVVHWLISHLGIYWIIICFAVSLILGPKMDGVLFFSAGAYFQSNGYDILKVFHRYSIPSYILSLPLLIAILLSYQQQHIYFVFRGFFLVVGIITIFNLVATGLKTGWLSEHPFLCKSSFFIFAAHNILVLHAISHYIVLHLIPFSWGELYNCIDLFLRPTIALVICLGLFWTMSKLTPRTLRLLTGGRI
ncbi:MAG: acyltransferase [Bacteroidales bacterium]|nr:acyltransferase [Bacteroidales bacterium]